MSEKKYFQVRKRKTNTIHYHMWNLKYNTNELISEMETDSQRWGRDLLAKREEVSEGRTGHLGLAGANYYV